MQPKPPRMPRNFYDERPEGCEDNYVDEFFLQGLVHKSRCSQVFENELSLCICNIDSFPELHYLQMIRQTSEIL